LRYIRFFLKRHEQLAILTSIVRDRIQRQDRIILAPVPLLHYLTTPAPEASGAQQRATVSGNGGSPPGTPTSKG